MLIFWKITAILFLQHFVKSFLFNADIDESLHKCSGQENIYIDKFFDISNLELIRFDDRNLMLNGSLTVLADHKEGTLFSVSLFHFNAIFCFKH